MGKTFSKKGKRLLLHKVLPAGLILMACTGGAYVVNSAQYVDHFLPGTVINGIDVSDMTVAEAERDIRAAEEDVALTMRFRGDTEANISATDVELTYDCGGELQELLNEQNRLAWLSRELGNEGSSHILRTTLSLSEDALTAKLLSLPELQSSNSVKPADAFLSLSQAMTFHIVPEVEGSTVNAEALAKEAETAMLSGKSSLDLTELTGVYAQPSVRSDNEDLLSRQEALNSFLGTSVKINLSDGSSRTVNAATTRSWISVNSDGHYTVDRDAVSRQAADYIAKIALLDDNYGYYRTFASTNYGMQRFDSDYLHGHTLDQAKMTEVLTEMLMSGTSGELDPVYAEMADTLDPHFGGTYVEVDIYNQHVYYYENYELIYDCKCVTGTADYTSTPTGIFSVDEKIRGRELEGYRSDGTLSYSVHVDYWIRFLPHYGLHDASWRDSFGGDIYEYSGSHGCVNLPTSAAAFLYDAVEYGTPVIIFKGTRYTGSASV